MRLARRDFLQAAAALGATALAGCTSRYGGDPVAATTTPATSTSASSTQLPSVVRLGVAEYRPYVYQDGSQLTGEVVEIATAACDRLGVELRVVLTPYDSLQPKLLAGGFDVVGAVRLWQKNCAWIDRYVPDHLSNFALAMPAANPLGLRTLDEVRAKQARLAVLVNSTDLESAQRAGVQTIKTMPNAEVALAAVTDNRVDCFLYDDITLHDLVAAKPALTVGPSFAPPDGPLVYGFGFGAGQGALAGEFADALAGLRESGQWLRVARPFGFTEHNVLTGEDAEKTCA